MDFPLLMNDGLALLSSFCSGETPWSPNPLDLMVFFQAGPLGFGIAFRVFLQPKYLPDFPLGSANIISTTLPIGFATFYALFEKDLPLTAWELPGQHAKAQQA